MSEINDHKEHYEKLLALFKHYFDITVLFLGLIALAVGFLTYTNGKEMRDDLKAQGKEMKDDLKSKEEKMDRELERMRTDAMREVDYVKNIARNMAESEAREKINEVFDKKNLDQFVEKVAEERIVPAVNAMVDKKISAVETARIDTAIVDLYSDDVLRFNKGLLILFENRVDDLSEGQIRRIIAAVDRKKDDNDYEFLLFEVIMYRKSPIVLEYMKKLVNLNEGYSAMNQKAISYFIIHKKEYRLLSDIASSVLRHPHPLDNYMSIIELCSERKNVDFLVGLLDSKPLVDQAYQACQADDTPKFSYYQDEVRKAIGTLLKEDKVNSLYFFDKK